DIVAPPIKRPVSPKEMAGNYLPVVLHEPNCGLFGCGTPSCDPYGTPPVFSPQRTSPNPPPGVSFAATGEKTSSAESAIAIASTKTSSLGRGMAIDIDVPPFTPTLAAIARP